jgi:hypothetical protein
MFRFNHLLEPRQSNYHKIQVVRQVQLKNNYIDVSFSNVYLLISLIAIINHFFCNNPPFNNITTSDLSFGTEYFETT